MYFTHCVVDRVYPLWLLPCQKTCSSTSRCFWHQAKLIRFSLDDSLHSEYLEASGTPDFDVGINNFPMIFTDAMPEATWKALQSSLKNSVVCLF